MIALITPAGRIFSSEFSKLRHEVAAALFPETSPSITALFWTSCLMLNWLSKCSLHLVFSLNCQFIGYQGC